MSENIIEVRYKTEDYLRIHNFLQYSNRRSKFIFGFAKIFFVIFALLNLIIAFLITKEEGFSSSIKFLLSGTVGLMLGFGIKKFERYMSKKSIDKQINSSPILQAVNLINFDEDGIMWQNDLTSQITKWEGFIKAVESDKDYLLYSTSRLSHFIPKHTFLDQEQENRFRKIVKIKLGDRARF